MNLILDFVLLLLGVGGLILGLRRGFLRVVLATIALLLAMAFAALIATPLVRVFVEQGGAQAETPIGIVFTGLLLAIYGILEGLLRGSFPDTRLRRLGGFDNILGFLVSPGWTLLVITLLVLCVAYTVSAVTGTNETFIGQWVRSSSLVAFLKDFFDIPISLMAFLFPRGLPQPLAFFATA
jgi:uncharacterized membrane protein required for colicin V production